MTAGTDNPRAEIHKRITRRLSNDEWMNKHFGISCHARDVADAVLELFEDITVQELTVWGGQELVGVRVSGQPLSTRLILKTAPEVQP